MVACDFPALNTSLLIAFKPVTSTSTKRSFSKQKLIKKRLKTTMTGKRLENVMKIS